MTMTTITRSEFFALDDRVTHRYTLSNGHMQAEISDYGGTLLSLWLPDRFGQVKDVVLGFDTKESILGQNAMAGVIVGRCAGRIRGGQAVIGRQTWQLPADAQGVHLHGGEAGFHRRIWDADVVDCAEGKALRLTLVSEDGEGGYPGRMDVSVTYRLSPKNELSISYEASADRNTLCNLTSHGYFNLAGHDAGLITGHIIQINSTRFSEIDPQLLPTGRILSVEDTPLDFRQPHPIGQRIHHPHPQILHGDGYDHNYILDHPPGQLFCCAHVLEPVSGRTMTVCTTSPCVQFYTGNALDGSQPGKDAQRYQRRWGFCLETQYAPNLQQHPPGESSVLLAGEVFRHTTVYAFGVTT